ncbi:MAG: histidinol dehydrogenase, partial [Bacteroidetes bacterium]|nr:histidinol dehydrogenase [Bacteroidota bacterium]
MKIFNYKTVSEKQLQKLFGRTSINTEKVGALVKPIVEDVKKNGDKAMLKYAKKFDGLLGNSVRATALELTTAEKKLDVATKTAINTAAKNIERFHLKQKPLSYSIETMPGVNCRRRHLP